MNHPIIKKGLIPIYTKRLELGFISEKHINDIYEIYSDEDLLRYTDNEYCKTQEEASQLICKYQKLYDNGDGLFLGIHIKANNSLVGIISVQNINYKHLFCTCSFLLRKKWWSQGIMIEATRSFFSYIFKYSPIYRIEAQVFTANINSIKMLTKLNMQREGRLRKNFLIAGVLEDSYIYSLLKNEFTEE